MTVWVTSFEYNVAHLTLFLNHGNAVTHSFMTLPESVLHAFIDRCDYWRWQAPQRQPGWWVDRTRGF